jgi:NAD-dependent SIR2 family protein deacetylase
VASDLTQRNIGKAAELIAKADALLITAGAGMGVDSGLPDFRGSEGFWRAYPALAKLKIQFEEMAQPQWFTERPEMAWAFYGHRQQLYRETKPHMGYSMLLDWGRAMPGGYFVVTSNVDGQFEKAGFPAERILEQHGSIHRMQCSRPCSEHIWCEEPRELDIDLENITARGRLPRCPECGDVARPNVLMFVDPDWLANVTREQEQRYRQWLASVRGRRLMVIELGAGTAIATIRMLGERLASERDRVTLVRINPDVTDAEAPVIPVRLGALEALQRIEASLSKCGSLPRRHGASTSM